MVTNYGNYELYHHGTKGQKWGIRRFQNEDGSLTPEGRKRYQLNDNGWLTKEGMKNYKADLKESKAFLKNVPVSEYRKTYFELANEVSKNELMKTYNKQLKLTDEYKDWEQFTKNLQSEGKNYLIAVNSKGKFNMLPADDASISKASSQGYKVVKSMDDVFGIVKNKK